MSDIERKGAFYLGKAYDLEQGRLLDEPVMYDARDLTTHAVCIGMTGSGKTGLGVDLLEEAALDGIPSIVIDPKGDMTNLLLTFPELRPSDFEPWVNVDDARRKGQTVAEYAATIAGVWAKGLGEWGESGERIRRLREAAEFTIYTPGSDAGIPISVLQTFRAPDLSWEEHEENIREIIASTVSGLLGLVGIAADPVRSREHIFLSHLFEDSWRRGEDLDLTRLIEAIQRPPLQRVGVFDVDTFYPEKERFELAMLLNNVLASPSFENWIEGIPLDIEQIIHTPDGRPRVAIFYIAHLGEAERQFFVTLLLQQVLSWMRRLSGTTSLRCLLYFDEVFGYFPPHPANPPTKRPLLTLLKIARAFGVGLVLTTQNPVDLDYKGLTNAGTWFIGKLQTDRDKARLLEGMEGVIAEAGTLLDRGYLDRLISSLSSRVFILHNVHQERPILFMTRWAMSYLRGPLTRSQVRELMRPLQERLMPSSHPRPEPTVAPVTPSAPPHPKPRKEELAPPGYTPVQPRVHGRVAQYFLPVEVSQAQASRQLASGGYGASDTARRAYLVYDPYLLGIASVVFSDAQGASQEEQVVYLGPLPDAHGLVSWEESATEAIDARDLATSPYGEALFGDLPDGMTDSSPYTRLRNDFGDYIYRERRIPVWVHADLKLRSRVGESKSEFLKRCEEEARRRRDEELQEIEARYERRLKQLAERLEREEQELEEDRIDYEGRKQEELLSAGESVLGMILGRRRSRALSQASRRRRMTRKAKAEVEESERTIEKLEKEIEALRQERDAALQEVRDAWAQKAHAIEEAALRPRRSDIRMEAFGLAWVPQWIFAIEDGKGTRFERVAAFGRAASSS